MKEAGKIKMVEPSADEAAAITAAITPYKEEVLTAITGKGVNGQEVYDALVAEIAKVKAESGN